MLVDAAVVANVEAGRIEETDACASAKATTQIGTQRQQGARYPLNKAPIADQAWKSTLPLSLHFIPLVGFKGAIGGLMEANHNCHDFAEAQTTRPLSVSQSIVEQLAVPLRFKLLAKIIDPAQKAI